MKHLYVLGGRQKSAAPALDEWNQYRMGVACRLDVETGAVDALVEYVTPPELCPDEEPSILFKAGHLAGGELFACTQTEVLVYSVPDFAVRCHVSLPLFNDLHHVRPSREGHLLVAVTGLDLVAEVSREGELLREWSVVEEDTWQRFSRDVDYRKVATTKPHRAHPNYVFEVGGEIWVTRFEQRDAICLTAPGGRMAIDVQRPHDGIPCEDEVFFTTVDGHVVTADARTGERRRVVDLNGIRPRARSLGWCRGLHVVDRDRVIVGFSRLRPTRWDANVSWVRQGIGSLKASRHLPTRLALYDLRRGEIEWEHSLEDAGVNVVFSIHDPDL